MKAQSQRDILAAQQRVYCACGPSAQSAGGAGGGEGLGLGEGPGEGDGEGRGLGLGLGLGEGLLGGGGDEGEGLAAQAGSSPGALRTAQHAAKSAARWRGSAQLAGGQLASPSPPSFFSTQQAV